MRSQAPTCIRPARTGRSAQAEGRLPRIAWNLRCTLSVHRFSVPAVLADGSLAGEHVVIEGKLDLYFIRRPVR